MLFDWFHQENCKQPSESLRRTSLVKQRAGRTNTQAAEQLHSEKAKDTYWLNMMPPSNHVFAFRLVTHFKNKRINEKSLKKHQTKLSEITLNNSQMRRMDLMSPSNTSNESDRHLPEPACSTTRDYPNQEASKPESARVTAKSARVAGQVSRHNSVPELEFYQITLSCLTSWNLQMGN